MFESAELGQKVDKKTFEARVEELRVELINAQYDLREADFPVVILLDGDDRSASIQALHEMHDWMDGRYLETQALGPPTEDERERPVVWRYWSRLPRKGCIAVFLDGWALEGIRRRVLGEIDDAEYGRWIEHVLRFEQMLVDDGMLIVKLWFHLPKKELKKRLKKAGKKKKQAWKVAEGAERVYELYDEAIPIAERLVRDTSTGESRWTVIESTDWRYASVTAAETIRAALMRRLAAGAQETADAASPTPADAPGLPDEKTVLDNVDLSSTLERDEYRERLADLQADVARLTGKALEKGVASVLAFEGWDAAGKGGVIRRLVAPIDPRSVRLVPVAAPTEEELAHHYLWRFWQHVPRNGRIAIFDRTWYGRVLVERVEGFAREDEWRRAYKEIRDFEESLAENGSLVLKFWLHIDPEEQLRRFQAREDTPYKQYKITEEDYRNREKWGAYQAAVHEMVSRTHVEDAPWHLVPANDKRFARIQVLETFCRGLEARL